MISSDVMAQKPFSVTGPRGALLGQQDGSFEAWIFPRKLLSHMRITADMKDYAVPIDVNEQAATIDVQPGRTTITLSHAKEPHTRAEVPTEVLIPAFIVSELKTAFQIGFLIFLPFLIIDLIVSSVLMSMGMIMLPPTFISLPFKILLFVLVDGWDLVIKALVQSFH